MRQERKNSANALADDIATQSRLRFIINTAPALIYSARPDGYIDFFNQYCLEFLGLPFEEISGWGWTKTVHPDDIEGLLTKWRAALGSGEPFTAESRVRRADGNYRWMLHRNVAIVDDQRKIVRWFGSSTDIDDQKGAEAALRQTTDELRRSEFYLAEGQRLAGIGSWSFTADGKREYCMSHATARRSTKTKPRVSSPKSWMMCRLLCRPIAGDRLKAYLTPI
jgi:PAS domain S-box-containing protein